MILQNKVTCYRILLERFKTKGKQSLVTKQYSNSKTLQVNVKILLKFTETSKKFTKARYNLKIKF